MRHAWIVNDAGYQFHNWYGFGAIHATRALAAARDFVPGSLGRFQRSGWFDAGGAAASIPDDAGAGATRTLAVAGLPALADIEAVVVEVDLDHPFPHDLAIELTSPSGTPSIVNPIFNEVLAIDRTGAAPLRWRLLSNAFYGEAPNGDWQLNVYDGGRRRNRPPRRLAAALLLRQPRVGGGRGLERFMTAASRAGQCAGAAQTPADVPCR